MVTEIKKPQTIISVRAENVMRLKLVEIKPDGSLFIIGGRNGQGKTSLINAMVMALAGGKAVPQEPIRRGEKRAQVVVETEDLIVTRKFSAKGTNLEVKGRDGRVYRTPQKILDALIGELTFDPGAFDRMDPRERMRTLQRLCGVETDGLDALRSEAYAQRTEVNRRLKTTEARWSGMPSHQGVPEEEVSVGEITTRYNGAMDLQRTASDAERKLEALRAKRTEIKSKIEQLQEELTRTNTEGKGLRATLETMIRPDVEAIKSELENLETTNRKVRENHERSRLYVEVEAVRDASTALTEKIQEIDQQRESMLAAVEYPIQGLGLSETGVTLEGVPYEQASSAERGKASAAIGFAMNPKLRALFIRDGSLYDRDSLTILAQMAEKAGARVFVERVGDGEECSVIIEDGEVEEERSPRPVENICAHCGADDLTIEDENSSHCGGCGTVVGEEQPPPYGAVQ